MGSRSKPAEFVTPREFGLLYYAKRLIIHQRFGIIQMKKETKLDQERAAVLDPRWRDGALDDLPEGMIIFDAFNRVAYLNPRASAILNRGEASGLGKSAQEIVDELAAQTVQPNETRAGLGALLASEKNYTYEFEIGSPMRRTIAAQSFALRIQPLESVGKGMLLRDVTREREADAMKSRLLSTVSHELRTPLASIKGFVTTLLRQDVKWDNAAQRDFLQIIEDETDRLTEIIDNLLDMSQLEAGALRIAPEPTQLRTIIREVVDEMRMHTEAHWFDVNLPADLPRILADPRRIRQVLHNLLGNAIKYARGGQVAVACEIDRDQIVVSVSDQGEGIAPDYLDKIFERFFQVDDKSTRRVGGAGLGLSISRGIVQAHGGKIWAESPMGHGAVFRFTLPIAPNEASERS